MLRRLFTLLSALSLLLCVASAVLWVRTYYVADQVFAEGARSATSATTARGTVVVRHLMYSREFAPYAVQQSGWGRGPPFDAHSSPMAGVLHPKLRLGFMIYSAGEQPMQGYLREWKVSLWLPVVLLAIAPAGWFAGWRRHRRRNRWHAEGRCESCGYDLRASTGRCSECGHDVPTALREAHVREAQL